MTFIFSRLVFAATLVELETSTFPVSESDDVVEICINAVGVNTPCPSQHPLHVTFSTTDISAGILYRQRLG